MGDKGEMHQVNNIITYSKGCISQVTGWIEENGKKLASPVLSGFWDSHLEATADVEGTQKLWQKNPLPSDGNRYGSTLSPACSGSQATSRLTAAPYPIPLVGTPCRSL